MYSSLAVSVSTQDYITGYNKVMHRLHILSKYIHVLSTLRTLNIITLVMWPHNVRAMHIIRILYSHSRISLVPRSAVPHQSFCLINGCLRTAYREHVTDTIYCVHQSNQHGYRDRVCIAFCVPYFSLSFLLCVRLCVISLIHILMPKRFLASDDTR